MNDQELYELCQQVYKRFPSWKYGIDWLQVINEGLDSEYIHRVCYEPDNDEDEFLYDMEDYDNVPLYTSDYLLERLPKMIRIGYWLCVQVESITKDGAKYNANYKNGINNHLYGGVADTPLKALLKLTLALHDAGQLPNQPTTNGDLVGGSK